MDGVVELEAALMQLEYLYSRVKQQLQIDSWHMLPAIRVEPELMRDANGRYILLDAQIEVAKVRIALVEAQRVTRHGTASADHCPCV